jgi:hypothetical protein
MQIIIFGLDGRTVENISPVIKDYARERLLEIIKFEFDQSKEVDFNDLLIKYGIKNDGVLAKCFKSLMNDPESIARKVLLSRTKNPSLLIEAWMANVCGLFMPFIYHEFQLNDFNTLLSQYPEFTKIPHFVDDFLANKFEHWEECNGYLLRSIKENDLKISDSHYDAFTTELKAIVLGGSFATENFRPHWLNENFINNWHDKYLALDTVVVKEHFPEAFNIQPDYVSIIDPRDNQFKRIDLQKELGVHYEKLKHLFSRPFYNYKVISTYMSWMTTNPKKLYDGVTVTKDVTNKETTSNDDTLSFQRKFISRYISIHPVEILCADYFGWTEFVKQTIHHEIVHRLQEKYVQCFMSIAFLEGKLRDTPSKQNYTYLASVKKDVDVNLLIELIKSTMSKLYIRETIPPEEQAMYNLEDRVQLHGGHTKAFSDVVMRFNRCETAIKQRKAFISTVLGHMIYRAYGIPLGVGFSWICSKTKKMEE